MAVATDSDRRLTEHYSGKIHVGFQKLRDMSKTLSAYIQENRHKFLFTHSYPDFSTNSTHTITNTNNIILG